MRVSRREGQPEERLILDRERIAELGLSVREVGRTLLANVGGLEAGRYREGGDEFPIMVRLRPEDRLNACGPRHRGAAHPGRRDRSRCPPWSSADAAAGRWRSSGWTASG